MSTNWSIDDLANLEAASRYLLSPLSAPSIEAWRVQCMQAVRRIVDAGSAMFGIEGGEEYLVHENTDPDLSHRNRYYIAEMLAGKADPPEDLVRRGFDKLMATGAGAYDGSFMHRLIGEDYRRSEYYNEVVVPIGGDNSYTLVVPNSKGAVMLSCWQFAREMEPDRYLPLLRALIPSLAAGLDVLNRFRAYMKVLDELSEPLMFFTEDGRELHRNTALVQLLNADSEHQRVLAEMLRVGKAVSPVRTFENVSPVTDGSRTIRTGKGEYVLRGTLLPPGAFVGDYSVLVSVTRKEAARLPGVDELCSQFRLSRRESEVALLLAEGLSNAEIADRLFLSQHTARRHTANIFEKLEVSSRKALALRFLRR